MRRIFRKKRSKMAKETQFGFEVPHAHLEDFSDLQDFHFALSCHCDNTKYKNFFREESLKGAKEVWLDNSWNETGKADDPIVLSRHFHNILADKVFCPDDIDWCKDELAKSYIEMTNLILAERIIVVVKNEGERDWLAKHGAVHFAVPFRYRRTKLYAELQWCKSYHFLGLNHIDEIKALSPPSVDTSMPIRIAYINHMTTDQWINEGCPHLWHKDLPSYYEIKLDMKTIDLARSNIVRLKEVCNEME